MLRPIIRNRLTETVLMTGHNIFLLRNKKNYLWIILSTPSDLELWLMLKIDSQIQLPRQPNKQKINVWIRKKNAFPLINFTVSANNENVWHWLFKINRKYILHQIAVEAKWKKKFMPATQAFQKSCLGI